MRKTALISVFVLCLCYPALILAEVPAPVSAQPGAQMQLQFAVLSSGGAPAGGLSEKDLTLSLDGRMTESRLLPARGKNEIILLFDRLSLEKKNLKRMLDELRPFLDAHMSMGDRVMVVLGGSSFELVQKPSSDPAAISRAFKKLQKSELLGDRYRGAKRSLIRSVSSAKTYQSSAFKESTGNRGGHLIGDSGLENDFGNMQVQQFRDQINRVRDQEMARILQALVDMERTIRGTAGRDVRRHLLWIGEDLFAFPGMDCYAALFDNFQAFRISGNLKIPEAWAKEKDLKKEFESIAALAQAMNVSLDLLDIADRDRYAADRINPNKRASGINKFQEGDPRNMVMNQTGAQAQSLNWGERLLASESGGIYFSTSRDTEKFFTRLSALLRSGYTLEFSAPGGHLDGTLHEVQLQSSRSDLEVFAPGKLAAAPALSRLIDLANAEMLMHLGENMQGLEIEAGEITHLEDGRVTQKFRIILPVDRVDFASEEGSRTAHLAIAVVMKDQTGAMTPAKVFEIPVKVDGARWKRTKKIASSFRLLVDSELEEIAFAVRDQSKGLSGSMSLLLSSPEKVEK